MSANEVSGNGWTVGGETLTSVVATAISGGHKVSSASPSKTATGKYPCVPIRRSARQRVAVEHDGSFDRYFLGDTTPADVPATTVGNQLTINCPANGWSRHHVIAMAIVSSRIPSPMRISRQEAASDGGVVH